MTTTKPSHKLSFHDRLSRLSFGQACKLLGPRGRQLIQEGGKREIDLANDFYLGGDLSRVLHRFCDRDVQIISGRTAERGSQYASDCFFTICNYEQVLKDILAIEQTPWDLIVLDEGQRIKNWEAKTSVEPTTLRWRRSLSRDCSPAVAAVASG